MQTIALALVLVAAGALGACSSEALGSADGGLDAGAPDSGGLFAGPTIGPDIYDCRVASAPLPRRPARAVPLSCAFDPACTSPLVVAHRSAGGVAPGLGVLAPENTLSALRAAIVLGVDFVETDPRLTRDGELVNVHDPDISLTTTGTGNVDALTWAQIQALPLRYPDTLRGDFSCERTLLIRELLVAAKGRILVLLDANKIPLEAVDALVDLVLETDTLAEAVFDTSSLDKVARARARAPNIRVHIRPDMAADIAPQVAQVGLPPPVILELDLGDLDEAIPEARRVLPSAKLMSDVLGGLDLQMAIEGEPPAELLDLYTRGVQLLQTDRPDLVLRALGR